ncbi:MAG: ribosome silencing factor [Anaerolineales bacterium]|nr:ribosome silencing factor [Anaerolineales bacterium]
MEPIELARSIADTLEDKKGEDILLLDLQDLAPLSDYFVICSGSTDRTIKALLDAVVDEAREKHKVKPRMEGKPEEGWLLADYGSVVVHIFSNHQREYYRLEDLWSEAKVLLHVQ